MFYGIIVLLAVLKELLDVLAAGLEAISLE